MVYQDFIKKVDQQKSRTVKALSLENSCSTNKIPAIVLSLIPNLIQLLENHSSFSHPKQNLMLCGLQPVAVSIQSIFPLLSKRIWDLCHPNMHFCCVLHYLFIPKKIRTLEMTENYQCQTLIIDFTTGLLMDNQCYLSKALGLLPTNGTVYGCLNQDDLNDAWTVMDKSPQITRAKNASSF